MAKLPKEKGKPHAFAISAYESATTTGMYHSFIQVQKSLDQAARNDAMPSRFRQWSARLHSKIREPFLAHFGGIYQYSDNYVRGDIEYLDLYGRLSQKALDGAKIETKDDPSERLVLSLSDLDLKVMNALGYKVSDDGPFYTSKLQETTPEITPEQVVSQQEQKEAAFRAGQECAARVVKKREEEKRLKTALLRERTDANIAKRQRRASTSPPI